ncbi:MAG TPA: MmgE/PrpD family protein [Roseomonas sp.]|jgi:2-methylcitrate dehydratase PrpD
MTEAVTARLATLVAETRWADLPGSVRHEGLRSFVNWLGCAVGGAPHPGVAQALRAATAFGGTPAASLLGLRRQADPMAAALVNGIASHVLDFDDTHDGTLIHPSAPVLSAALALAEWRGASGQDLLLAFLLGVEAACRVGMAISPAHYDAGWHITGTAGAIGAAAASARLLGLDAARTAWAIGIGATQPVGLRVHFGSMVKSFHPGRAAQNGMLAALLAAEGFDAAPDAIEGRRGFAEILAGDFAPERITEGLGTRFEIMRNTYKPFACGLVVHPVIDLCLRLRTEPGFAVEQVETVALRVHPLVMDLTGKRAPSSGLEGKFSVFHAAAVALVDGAGGEREFSDARVRDPAVVALRGRVEATVDPACRRTESEVTITLRDGRRLNAATATPLGSLENPMSDAALGEKFRGLAAPVLGADAAARLLGEAWTLADQADLGWVSRGA